MTEVTDENHLREVALSGDIALPITGGRVEIGVNERGKVYLRIVATPDNGEVGSLLTASVNTRVARYIAAALDGSITRADAFAERPLIVN